MSDRRDDEWSDEEAGTEITAPFAYSTRLLRSLGAQRRALFQHTWSELAGADNQVFLEHMHDYCKRQAEVADPHRRHAYQSLGHLLAEVKPDSTELHAICRAWAIFHQQRAEHLCQVKCGTLAEEFTTMASVCNEVDQYLQRISSSSST